MRVLALALLLCFARSCSPAAERRYLVPPEGQDDARSAAERVTTEERVFAAALARHQGRPAAELLADLAPASERPQQISFDPREAQYYELVTQALELTPAEQELLARQGVVVPRTGQHYSMPFAYYEIYAKDLPVLVTADSILHALHLSYDGMLKEQEGGFHATLRTALAAAHAELARVGGALPSAELTASARDIDLYLTVARSLLEPGPPDGDPTLPPPAQRSVLGQDAAAAKWVQAAVAASGSDELELYGERRPIDFTQFKPRAHYTDSPQLSSYFRAMMWLGRADTAFMGKSGAAAERALRSASLLVLLLERSGAAAPLAALRAAIDFWVGRADSLCAPELLAALQQAGIRRIDQLDGGRPLAELRANLARSGAGQQQIRGQALAAGEPLPFSFQLFGQAFLLDSYVLSKLVFDSVPSGPAGPRAMPSGLDVMAALGSAEAVELLRGELAQYEYGAQLLAARAVVESYRPQDWHASLVAGWLGALRELRSDATSGLLPEVMRTQAWKRKELQAQLASWAELRHDTLLYAKPSYMSVLCAYPAGYVEPYPEFYRALGALARRAEQQLGAPQNPAEPLLTTGQPQLAAFFARFAERMTQLETLSRKELAGQPFNAEEEDFLKRLIRGDAGGSGPPRFTGWYMDLIYGGSTDWWPVVADVHTDPNSGEVLEVATGPAELMVVAIDNQTDRALYVGPTSSYYEFRMPSSQRMTDEDWHRAMSSPQAPPPPAWLGELRGPPRE